MVYWIKFIE